MILAKWKIIVHNNFKIISKSYKKILFLLSKSNFLKTKLSSCGVNLFLNKTKKLASSFSVRKPVPDLLSF